MCVVHSPLFLNDVGCVPGIANDRYEHVTYGRISHFIVFVGVLMLTFPRTHNIREEDEVEAKARTRARSNGRAHTHSRFLLCLLNMFTVYIVFLRF